MGDASSQAPLSADMRCAVAVKPFWPWLSDLLAGRKAKGDLTISGFVARRDGPTWMVIVRGFNVVTWEKMVCFGNSESLYEAMRNVTLAVAKGQWRKDRY